MDSQLPEQTSKTTTKKTNQEYIEFTGRLVHEKQGHIMIRTYIIRVKMNNKVIPNSFPNM